MMVNSAATRIGIEQELLELCNRNTVESVRFSYDDAAFAKAYIWGEVKESQNKEDLVQLILAGLFAIGFENRLKKTPETDIKWIKQEFSYKIHNEKFNFVSLDRLHFSAWDLMTPPSGLNVLGIRYDHLIAGEDELKPDKNQSKTSDNALLEELSFMGTRTNMTPDERDTLMSIQHLSLFRLLTLLERKECRHIKFLGEEIGCLYIGLEGRPEHALAVMENIINSGAIDVKRNDITMRPVLKCDWAE